MIDIKFLRENPDIVKENIKKKFQDEKIALVDEVIELDKKAREAKSEADELRSKMNKSAKQIGALMGQGKKDEAEAVKAEVADIKQKIKDLEPYQNELLHITDDERELGCKHVIQTRLTKDTVGERIRTNGDMWKREETFIDGNIQLVLNRMREFYGE